MLSFVCFKWRDPNYRYGTPYGADHVNRLASMLNRHVSGHFDFVCVTDSDEGLDPGVRVVNLWPDLRDMGGTWTRLRMFDPEVASLFNDRVVLLDLDCVIVDKLDSLFDTDADFITTRSTNPYSTYNTGFYMLRMGSRPEVWREFSREAAERVVTVTGHWEQKWISHVLGPNERTWGAADGVLQYNTDVMRRNGGVLPADARVVFFPGPYDPSHAAEQQRSPWIVEHWR